HHRLHDLDRQADVRVVFAGERDLAIFLLDLRLLRPLFGGVAALGQVAALVVVGLRLIVVRQRSVFVVLLVLLLRSSRRERPDEQDGEQGSHGGGRSGHALPLPAAAGQLGTRERSRFSRSTSSWQVSFCSSGSVTCLMMMSETRSRSI